jgi:hypothetical protein
MRRYLSANMDLATCFREFILLLPLTRATLLLWVTPIETTRATHPFFKLWGLYCTIR